MDKGFVSTAVQDILIQKVKEALTKAGQKPIVILAAVLGLKAVFMYADDVLAENKLPKELTEKVRGLLDAVLIDKDWDKALVIAIDLVPYLYEMFKPKPVETPAVTDGK